MQHNYVKVLNVLMLELLGDIYMRGGSLRLDICELEILSMLQNGPSYASIIDLKVAV